MIDNDVLAAAVNTIVPADEFPSAADVGGVDFVLRIVEAEKPEWRPKVERVLAQIETVALDRFATRFVELDPSAAKSVLDSLVADSDYLWFAALVNEGFYADPSNGANRGGASWRMVGWEPGPPGGWPLDSARPHPDAGIITGDDLREHYDAIVVGSGAGGGVAADLLTRSGRRVLVVEAGEWPETAVLAQDHLRNPRGLYGLDSRSGPPTEGNPRTVTIAGTTLTVGPAEPSWGNNAMTLGGGTRVYGAQAWRFAPTDFRMASTYGVPNGSALADWPISYEDLEPYYSQAEWEVGVSGSVVGDTSAGFRSRDFPMPPIAATKASSVLGAGAAKLGISTVPVPLLINSTEYDGRHACVHCSQCVGFACPVDAKNGSHNTTLARALDSGLCELLLSTTAESIATDASGRVIGVRLAARVRGSVWRRTVVADQVIVSAGAVESARLLLASTSDREPNGLGNNNDQVGRHLQAHLYGGALGIFDEPIVDLVGPGVSIATCDFRHGNDGIIGGGMIANEFVSTPASTHEYLIAAGLIEPHGLEAKRGMRSLASRLQRVVGPVQEVTSADSRVQLDPVVRDGFGNHAAHLSGSLHEEDLRAQALLVEKATQWLRASGATTVVGATPARLGMGPSSGQHQAGTCRMGSDPATSVVDPEGRVWGHDNLRVVDGSVHVTNGGVNPVLTILATAFRTMDLMLR
jgi:choline dehydrogenase-like flavoprotein